jgi:hypothetical protein
LHEFGQIVPQGAANAARLIAIVEDPESGLPADAIATLDAEITRRAKENEVAWRLMTIPGIGPLIATAIAVLAPPPETFRKARDFAAWLGLTPRQHSTGGKQRLGATTKMGDRSLRRLLIIGANIRAVAFTPSREGDSPVLPDLLDQIPDDEDIVAVTADGAYDTRRCHSAIIARGATAIIPIRKNGRPWKEDCPAAKARNETLRATRHYSRAFWKRWTGYHARSRAEAKMRCLKAFGERIAARDPDRQTAEIHIRVALMNRFNALGTAEIVRVA